MPVCVYKVCVLVAVLSLSRATVYCELVVSTCVLALLEPRLGLGCVCVCCGRVWVCMCVLSRRECVWGGVCVCVWCVCVCVCCVCVCVCVSVCESVCVCVCV